MCERGMANPHLIVPWGMPETLQLWENIHHHFLGGPFVNLHDPLASSVLAGPKLCFNSGFRNLIGPFVCIINMTS